MRSNQPRLDPTFAQTVVLIQTLPMQLQMDVEAIIQRHLALGFTYSKDQIYRALDAVRRNPLDRPPNPRSGRWT